MNRAQLLQRQIGIHAADGVGEDTLREAYRRFLAPPLTWKPTPTLLSRLALEGYWPELVKEVVAGFIIEVLERDMALQNIDSFFIEYVRCRLPKDESAEIDLPLVKRALFQIGFNVSITRLVAARKLFENYRVEETGSPSSRFYRFYLKYAELL